MIGIEYVVPEETFQALDDEEKKYWHSHKFGEHVLALCLQYALIQVGVIRGREWDVAARNEGPCSLYVSLSLPGVSHGSRSSR